MCRTWDYDRRFLRVDPIVRRDVFHVLDGEILWRAGARWLRYRLDDLGRVQAHFDVDLGEGVTGRSGGGASPPPTRTADVVAVCMVRPVAAAATCS